MVEFKTVVKAKAEEACQADFGGTNFSLEDDGRKEPRICCGAVLRLWRFALHVTRYYFTWNNNAEAAIQREVRVR